MSETKRDSEIAVVRSPGLIEEWREILPLAESFRLQERILLFKAKIPALWAVILGGTGTGKSTIFNALCEKPLSETGIERPKTSGPILYAYKHFDLRAGIPFGGIETTVTPVFGEDPKPTPGQSGRLVILEHDREDLSHLLLADTPDLDSVETVNRQVAEHLYLLSDAVIFVASQEKYADEVPHLFLLRILEDQRLCYLILNKAAESSTKEDVLSTLQRAKRPFPHDHVWLFPFMPNQPSQAISRHPVFRDFQALFLKELSEAQMPNLRKKTLSRCRRVVQETLERLLALTAEERGAAQEWVKELRRIEQKSAEDFIKEQRESFSLKGRDALKREIRRLFSKYDVLAGPRRVVRETLLAPLRLIGILQRRDEDRHKEELRKVRQKMDLLPIQTAVEKFNRRVLEKLSPRDKDSPLFKSLREEGTALTAEEIRDLVWKAQDQLEDWLEKRFDILSRNLPRTKRWGIHTTSILWGILIVSFEIAVGGGFTIIDAVVDSVLAPFVTKGTVELFAYHEIQKVTRELGERYQREMLSVMEAQRERYERCLHSLLMPDETAEALQELGRQAARIGLA